MPSRARRPSVHKFGGAALADAASIRGVATIVRSLPGVPVVVVSALAGITDLLLELVRTAEAGELEQAQAGAEAFRTRHLQVVAELLPTARRRTLVTAVSQVSDELTALASALAVLREASPRVRDHIVARGERLSARIVASALSTSRRPAEPIDPGTVIITDGPYGGAAPDFAATRTAARAVLEPLLARGVIPVVPGFLGHAPDGGLATLGRGGSDLTATTLAAALGAVEVTLWKDVPGLLTADPRIVPDARLLPLVHPSEAAELAYYGAKVLHPRALLPLAGSRTALRVRPFADLAASGTEISARREVDPPPVRSLSAVQHQALVTVAGTGILGVPGMSARTFGALQSAGISVSLIAQASSEYTIDFTVPSAAAREAVSVLQRAFRSEIQHGELETIRAREGIAIMAVVGRRMAGHPGIAARVFDALEAAEVNVVAIAQGSSEHNISVVVEERDVPAGLRRIHAAFQLGKEGGGRPRRRTGKDVVLLGAGTIGQATLDLLASTPQRFAALRIVAVIDRRGMIENPAGFEPGELAAIARHKRNGGPLAGLPGGRRTTPRAALEGLARRALIRPAIVDLTAEDTGALLRIMAESGFDVVLANKRPLAGPLAEYRALLDALEAHGGRLRHEATVGAGLPFILAVRQLIATGDKVRRIEGALSGTLGSVLSALDTGGSFAEAVRAARAAGMTEPDPRDDLSGMDVARKALILDRLLGHRRELADVQVESLVRRGGRSTAAGWLAGLDRDDAWWRARAARAHDAGTVLRYVASIGSSRVEVGLKAVSRADPLGQLTGSANRVVIRSGRYAESPLVITGPGAGPDVTATGVLADLLSLTGA
jgi:aspartokinase/homoserine dehydrogenase 1